MSSQLLAQGWAQGPRKILTFWMPLLFGSPDSIQVVVTSLNILGKHNVACLDEAGLKGIFISAESATAENFRVCRISYTCSTLYFSNFGVRLLKT